MVVMDDNIEKLLVEIPDDSLVAQRKAAGIMDYGAQPLTWKTCLRPLMGTGLQTVEEPELLSFLCGVSPELEKNPKLEEILRKMQVTSLQKFKSLPPQRIAALLKAMGLPPTMRKKFLEASKGMILAMPSKGAKTPGPKPKEPELSQLISRAGRDMQRHHVHLWGVSPTKNHFFLKTRGDEIRRRAKETGIFKDYSTRLGLVFGAWFGVRVTHNPSFYTRCGQIKDDVERTLRYWHADKRVLRYSRYAANKGSFCPGQFKPNKGGISSNSSQQDHSLEAQRALSSLIEEFGAYVRLPKGKERSSTGLVWNADCKKNKKKRKEPPEPPVAESKKIKL